MLIDTQIKFDFDMTRDDYDNDMRQWQKLVTNIPNYYDIECEEID